MEILAEYIVKYMLAYDGIAEPDCDNSSKWMRKGS